MRSVFVACGAFLGRIDGETQCAFWPEEPIDHAFDASCLIEIDLARTPNAAIAGEIGWDEVVVDDCFTGPTGALAGTTLGPRWPELSIAGVVCLEQRFFRALPDERRPAVPPPDMPSRDYEYHSVLYWPGTTDARAGRRYTGHHAELLEQRGSLAHVRVYPPGTSAVPDARSFALWIDLASSDQCDAGADSLTRIGIDGLTAGPLFLISGGT